MVNEYDLMCILKGVGVSRVSVDFSLVMDKGLKFVFCVFYVRFIVIGNCLFDFFYFCMCYWVI